MAKVEFKPPWPDPWFCTKIVRGMGWIQPEKETERPRCGKMLEWKLFGKIETLPEAD